MQLSTVVETVQEPLAKVFFSVIPPERISVQTVEQHADLLAPQMVEEAVETVQLVSRTHPSTMFEVLEDVLFVPHITHDIF